MRSASGWEAAPAPSSGSSLANKLINVLRAMHFSAAWPRRAKRSQPWLRSRIQFPQALLAQLEEYRRVSQPLAPVPLADLLPHFRSAGPRVHSNQSPRGSSAAIDLS